MRVPEAEDPTVARHEPIAVPARRRCHADDRKREVLAAQGPPRASVADPAHVAIRRREPEAAAGTSRSNADDPAGDGIETGRRDAGALCATEARNATGL